MAKVAKNPKRAQALTEKVARRAVAHYFEWYASENGSQYHAEYSKLRSLAGHHEDGRGFTFRMVYGGRPVWVREVLPGRLEVWRQDMPKGTFKLEEL